MESALRAERDAMGTKLAQRGEAMDAAIYEAQQAGERRQLEAENVRRHAQAEVEAMRGQVSSLQSQLSDAAAAAAGLQELLEAQQRVADAYRKEAARTLNRLSHLEQHSEMQQPLQQTLLSYREAEASARQALASELLQQQQQLQQAVSGVLQKSQSSYSLEDVSKGLDELRSELKISRQREDEQRMSLQAARLVVQ